MTEHEKQAIIEGIDKKLVEDTLLLERARRSVALHNQFLEFLQKIVPNYPFAEFNELAVLNDFHSYTLFSLLDLYVTIKGILSAKTDWERIFFIKHGYLVVFESLDTYYLHNTELNKLISGNYPSIREKFKVIAAEIKTYTIKHGYREEMAAMRNSIIAHIGTAFEDYYDRVLQLTGDKGIDAVLSFMVILQHLQEFLGSFVSEANSEWKEAGNKHTESIELHMTRIEALFQQNGTDPKELIEIKNNLLKAMASVRKNIHPDS